MVPTGKRRSREQERYEIDVPGDGYRKLNDFDYDLHSAVWGHEPDTIVHSEGLGNGENLSVNDDQIATVFVSNASSDVMRAGLSDQQSKPRSRVVGCRSA